MAVFLIIIGAVITLLVAMLLFRYRPSDMSEVGFKHFRTGLLFAILSAIILAFIVLLWIKYFDSLRGVLFLFVLMGTICNGIGSFCFLRELIQLLPEKNITDITPEGMVLGVWMVLVQVFLLILGFGTMLVPLEHIH